MSSLNPNPEPDAPFYGLRDYLMVFLTLSLGLGTALELGRLHLSSASFIRALALTIMAVTVTLWLHDENVVARARRDRSL